MVDDSEERPGEFERHSKALFDQGAEALSGNIRSRLTQARHRAVAEIPNAKARATRRFWIPAAGLSAAALTAVLVVRPWLGAERGLPDAFASADDMALLMNADDLELLEDMEFYAWLDSDPEALPAAPTDSDDAHS